jgi:hypothetical protein
MRRLEIADQRWDAALADSAFAPPDSRFADRLRAIAGACEAEAVVLQEAASNASLRWNPVTEPGPKGLTYELRPGGNRPGPGDLWTEFDRAVDALADSQAGDDFARVADAYRHLGQIAIRLAGAIDAEREDEPKGRRDVG